MAGSLVVVFVWVYSAQILRFGALFSDVYVRKQGRRPMPVGTAGSPASAGYLPGQTARHRAQARQRSPKRSVGYSVASVFANPEKWARADLQRFKDCTETNDTRIRGSETATHASANLKG